MHTWRPTALPHSAPPLPPPTTHPDAPGPLSLRDANTRVEEWEDEVRQLLRLGVYAEALCRPAPSDGLVRCVVRRVKNFLGHTVAYRMYLDRVSEDSNGGFRVQGGVGAAGRRTSFLAVGAPTPSACRATPLWHGRGDSTTMVTRSVCSLGGAGG